MVLQVWDIGSGNAVHTLRGHTDEILDVSFNTTGSRLVTASADGNSRVFNTMTGACTSILSGHEGEVSKVTFNPQGSRILTASSDKTGVWCVAMLCALLCVDSATAGNPIAWAVCWQKWGCVSFEC